MDRNPAAFRLLAAAAALGLTALPLWASPFYLGLAGKILIYGIAAMSLDIILGYGGMVSLGHAAFLGTGAYAAAILSCHGIRSAWIAWPLATGISALLALIIGALSLRTTGTYFIMITLAFAQMLFYFFGSLSRYGGDDGMAMASRNLLEGVCDLSGPAAFYYVTLIISALCLYSGWRLTGSRFGWILRGIRVNEQRMRALGFPAFRYKLMGFVLSGALAGLAGALIANHGKYVSPALLHWTRSGDILVMVILGGMGSLAGPFLGAAVLLLSEEVLSAWTRHWMIFLGPLLIALFLFARGGIRGLVRRGNPP